MSVSPTAHPHDAERFSKRSSIVTNFELVGSGARNMITRNGDGPYDLDYNLVIVHLPDQYKNNLGNLKETVRRCLNNAVRSNDFDDAQDSTSVLTSIRHFNDTPNVVFSFDVAIIMYNSNGTSRAEEQLSFFFLHIRCRAFSQLLFAR